MNKLYTKKKSVRTSSKGFGKSIYLGIFLLFLFFSQLQCFAEEIGRITDIRFWQSPEEAQVVLDLSFAPKVSPVGKLRDGTLFFDVVGCSFRPGRQRYPLKNPFLDILTVQERTKGIVRVFFRVPMGVEAKTFVLPKNQKKADRIVIFLREPVSTFEKRRKAEINEVQKLKSNNVKIVVLDPGHGGEDPGTSHNGIIEKHYVLTIGKLIKAYFDRDPRFKAILTRSGDYIIPLERRREISERLGADAFVSLHVNYNSRKHIRGIEVYYESPKGAVGEAERLVAEKENEVDFSGSYGKPAVTKVKKTIVKQQAATMFQSRQLAEKIESRLNNSVKSLPSRGVKRAGFKVLHSMAMPSILVEFGYTSNIEDSKILKNYTYRTRLAQGIYLGVRDFLSGNIEQGVDQTYLAYIQKQENLNKSREKKKALAKEKLKRAQKRAKKYKIKKGDYLSKIAKNHKVTISSICYLNGISIKSTLIAGRTLLIPRR